MLLLRSVVPKSMLCVALPQAFVVFLRCDVRNTLGYVDHYETSEWLEVFVLGSVVLLCYRIVFSWCYGIFVVFPMVIWS